MKKFVLILTLCFSVISLFAQNVYDRKVTFEYIRLPLQPLKKSIKNYQGLVTLEYEGEVKARKEAFAKIIADAEKKYQDDEAEYDKKVKDAGVRYAQDMAAYKINKKTNPNLQEPILILPPKPEKYIPVDNHYYPKPQNPDNLAKTYISLDGYTRSQDNSVLASFLLRGFDYTEPELKINEVSKTKDGVTYKEKEFYYEMNYKYPMGLKMEYPDGVVIFNQYFDELNRYSTYRSEKYKSDTLLIKSFNKVAVLSGIEDKILADNMRFVNDFMNNNFGFTKVSVSEAIFLVQEKKFSYPEFKQAFEAVSLGFGQLTQDVNRTVAAQNLNAGVSQWENALKESQPKNKKARVNENVTTAALFNIALVSIYANEFNRAEVYLNKIFASEASKREQRRVEQIKAFMKGQKQRYDAYSQSY